MDRAPPPPRGAEERAPEHAREHTRTHQPPGTHQQPHHPPPGRDTRRGKRGRHPAGERGRHIAPRLRRSESTRARARRRPTTLTARGAPHITVRRRAAPAPRASRAPRRVLLRTHLAAGRHVGDRDALEAAARDVEARAARAARVVVAHVPERHERELVRERRVALEGGAGLRIELQVRAAAARRVLRKHERVVAPSWARRLSRSRAHWTRARVKCKKAAAAIVHGVAGLLRRSLVRSTHTHTAERGDRDHYIT